jgi:adenylate cyclase
VTEYDKRKWANCFKAGIFAALFSVIPMSGVSSYRWAYPVLGFISGFLTGLFELFVFRDFLRQVNFFYGLILKSFCYALTLLLLVLFGLSLYLLLINFPVGGSVQQFMQPAIFTAFFHAFAVSILLVFLFQLDDLLGDGTFRRYIMGYYHKPKLQNTVVMFLDIKGSTHLAESLGDHQYYSLIDDFFHHISMPVIQSKGFIYKYVGDEAIITWNLRDGLSDARCIKLFFAITDRLEAKREYYLEKYGVFPEYRAAMHLGPVIIALIGDIRKEIVYNGDVLNTTKRIEEVAGDKNKSFVVSELLIPYLPDNHGFEIENLGKLPLKGKAEGMSLYSLTRKVAIESH